MMWRALLIDDEAPARAHMRELLTAHPEVDIVGEAAGVAEAAQLCQDLNPTLLFLDLQMPKGSGFELLARINPVPELIFVTAYETYAVRAFEVNAIDYLLKPVFADRLEMAMSRLAARKHGAEIPAAPALREDDRVFLRTSQGLRVALVRQITHISAEGNYTSVWLLDGSCLLIDRSMHEWEEILPTTKFVRADRSLILNVDHIHELRIVSRDFAELNVTGRRESLRLGRAALSRLRPAVTRV